MLIYRVEDGRRLGPYGDRCPDIDQFDAGNHPVPVTDGIPYHTVKEETRFGFESITQLRAWFSYDELIILYVNGYFISVYTVYELGIIIGDRQVAFDSTLATLVDSMTIDQAAEKYQWRNDVLL